MREGPVFDASVPSGPGPEHMQPAAARGDRRVARGGLAYSLGVDGEFDTGLRPVLGTFDPHPATPALAPATPDQHRLRRTSTGYAGSGTSKTKRQSDTKKIERYQKD